MDAATEQPATDAANEQAAMDTTKQSTAIKRKASILTEDEPAPTTEPPLIPAATIDGHLWAQVIQYLALPDLQSLRLAGNRKMCPFHNPLFTSHLPLRMDLVPFFGADERTKKFTPRHMRMWLHNRKRLLINGGGKATDVRIHPGRVAALIQRGYMTSVTEMVITNCSHYRQTIKQLSRLPNLKYLKLYDRYPFLALIDKKGVYYESVVKATTEIVGSLMNVITLETLDIEFDCMVSGNLLAVLRNMHELRSLRLRGFDLSKGLEHLHGLTNLEHLHLCHGNTCCSSEDLIPPGAFDTLPLKLRKLKSIHVENMDCMTHEQIKPICQAKSVAFLTFKHCQEVPSKVLTDIGTMSPLQELHFINCPTDVNEPFDTDDLECLGNLKNLKILTLMFVLTDEIDILDLEGCEGLEVLNVGLHEDMTKDEFDKLCTAILPCLPKLKKLRLFGTDPSFVLDLRVLNYDIDFRFFDVGHPIELGDE